MSIALQPPELKKQVKTLAKKLLERIDQQPEKQPSGFIFTDLENTVKGAKIGGLLLSGIITSSVGVILMFNFFVGFSITLLALVPGLILVIVGISSFFLIPGKLQALRRANPGELCLKSYPLRLGETMTLTFRRSLKAGYQAKTQGKVWGRLICLEVYMDNRGSGSASFYGEVVWYQDLPPLLIPPGASRFEQDWHIRIPEQGTPTINIKALSESQCVLWGVDVLLDIPGLIKDDSVFCLLVEPQVVQ